MDASKTPRLYPCLFPIKVIGMDNPEFEQSVLDVLSTFIGDIPQKELRKTSSKNGKYISLTIEVVATDRGFIEQIYKALNAQENVLMVL